MNKELSDTNEKGEIKKKKKNGENQDMNDILKKIMFGFGDDSNHNEETVKLLEKYMVEFLQDLACKSYKRSLRIDSASKEIHKSDVLYFIRKDKKKYLRALKILISHAIYQEVKKKINEKNPLEVKEDDDELSVN